MFKWLFWLGIIAGGVFVGGQVIPIYYNNLKVENVFEGTSQNLKNSDTAAINSRIQELFKIQSVDLKALPPEFSKNLTIKTVDGKLQISSKYHIVLWLLGEPQSVDPDQAYKESEVKPMDKLRIRARMDFDFAPFAESGS
ncbi:MAG: hypothetical protein R8M46_08975 [Ghiorsea sp.]